MREKSRLIFFFLMCLGFITSLFVIASPQKIFVTAYLSKYNWEEAVNSLRDGIATPDEISPQWYTINEQGSILPIVGFRNDDRQQLVSIAHGKHIPIKPIIANLLPNDRFEPALFTSHLFVGRDEVEKLSQEISDLVIGRDYDGIVIDFEGVTPLILTNLIEVSAKKLHAHHKTLGVIMEPSSVGSFDAWYQIGKSADSIQLIAYDEHNAGTKPGPIASLSFVQKNLDAALKTIPAEKLTLGVGIYAAMWSDKGSYTSGSWQHLIKENFEMWHSGAPIKKSGNADGSVMDVFWYGDGKGSHIHYEDGRSVERKVLLARKAGVSHIALWHLGGEDPDIWVRLKALKRWHFR